MRSAVIRDFSRLLHWIHATLPISIACGGTGNQSANHLRDAGGQGARDAYETRVGGLPMELLDQEERRMVLIAIDRQWQQHLDAMDELREGVYLRAQGQKDPSGRPEYKNEGYELFVKLLDG
jgi:preprotein translocase subunit SecA